MTIERRDLQVVVLADDDLARFAETLEHVARELPHAAIAVARPGLPAVDEMAERLAAAGIGSIDVPIADGLPGVLDALGSTFAGASWCYLFAGERLPDGAGEAIGAGAAIVGTPRFAWLPTPQWCGPRRFHGATAVEAGDRSIVAVPDSPIDPTWSMIMTRAVHCRFASFEELLDDIGVLAQLGELDAAYQRAELSWRDASGVHQVQLVRATTLLADLLDLGPAPLRAAARWFSLEPEPFTAFAYARAAAGTIPHTTIERVLAQVPTAPVDYHDGTVGVPLEAVVRLRHNVEHHYLFATTAFESGLRGLDDAEGSAASVAAGAAAAVSAGYFIGRDVDTVVRRLPADAEAALAFLPLVRPDIESGYAAALVRSLRARYGRHPRIDAFERRVETVQGTGDVGEPIPAVPTSSARELLAVAS